MRNYAVTTFVISASLCCNIMQLSDLEIERLGQTIWKSECNGSHEGLLTWNKGEPFPSLGIGHFIWYPSKCTARTFEQTFPDLILFLKNHNAQVPQWLLDQCKNGCPWQTKEDFITARRSQQMQELHQLLINTVNLQARFIVMRFEKELDKMISIVPNDERCIIKKRIEQLARSYQGAFALIDYVHFKGSGTNANEAYEGHSWGLLSVVRSMQDQTPDSLSEFVRVAKQLLTARVEHAPNKEQEQRWIKGWHARVDRYLHI